MDKEFDRDSLGRYDGSEENPAYVAQDGIVYDVSGSRLWENGVHMKRHQAGQDLSADFAEAPHGTEVFERVRKVGRLRGGSEEENGESKEPESRLQGLLERYPMLRRHPHPIMVHFPIAFLYGALIFALLALLSGWPSFGVTAFHCLAAGIIFLLPAIGSGFFTWWLNYRSRLLKPIKIKIIGAIMLLLIGIPLFIWRLAMPNLLFSDPIWSALYLACLLIMTILVTVVGWYGGSLVFPIKKKE